MQNENGSVTAVAGAPTPLRASDPHDFAGLYLRHRASFTLHARRYLKDERDADEVVQEAFLRLFLALPELETELQALAYCRRTITNLAIDRYRSDARRPRLVDLDSAPVDQLVGDDVGDPVVRAEEAALVRDALAQLPALHRAALVKREIEEKPLSVIADELDIPEDNVKHVLFRARRGLRKLLARTSVAPGADVEAGPRLARPRTSGAIALALLLALGLGSGPDLEAVPVVGVDLPDVIGVTRLVDTVSDVVDRVLPGGDGPTVDAAAEGGRRDGDGAPGAPATDGEDGTQQPTGAGPAATGALGAGVAVPAVGGGAALPGVPAASGTSPAVDGPRDDGSGPVQQVPGESGPGTGAGTRPDTSTPGGSATGPGEGGRSGEDDPADRGGRAREAEDRAVEDPAEAADRAARDQADAADRAAERRAEAELEAAKDRARAEERAAKDRSRAEERAAEDRVRAEERAAEDRAKAEREAAKERAEAEREAAKDRAEAEERAARDRAEAAEDSAGAAANP